MLIPARFEMRLTTIKEVQDRVGHTNIKTTMDIYTHLTEQAKEEAVLKFENYLNPKGDS
ncbi:hypothetical protein ACLIBG_10485 [Virgibacillus sp. W0181]|uniref:hypothetical protein n=1 Tax=Virgibacillus sp. W0181 TaxID=3391581 RepID=UPI003F47B82B